MLELTVTDAKTLSSANRTVNAIDMRKEFVYGF